MSAERENQILQILTVLSGQDFHDWYTTKFEDFISGQDGVTKYAEQKENICRDIRKIFRRALVE